MLERFVFLKLIQEGIYEENRLHSIVLPVLID